MRKRADIGIGNLVIMALMTLNSSNVLAQVNKCVDGKGKISYSETPCEATQKGQQLLGKSATLVDPERDEESRKNHIDSINRTMQQHQEAINGHPHQAQQSIRQNKEQSIEQDDERCETYAPSRGCIGGERKRNPNWSPRKGYFGGGGPADQKRISEESQNANSNPGQMVNCDRAGCWGSQNNIRYNRAAGGNLIGTNGQLCKQAGNSYICH